MRYLTLRFKMHDLKLLREKNSRKKMLNGNLICVMETMEMVDIFGESFRVWWEYFYNWIGFDCDRYGFGPISPL